MPLKNKFLLDNDDFFSDVRWFNNCVKDTKLTHLLNKVQLIITDIDASLTDGTIFLTKKRNEKELKGVSMQDNYGIEKALEKNYKIAFISGRKSSPFKQYIKTLGIPNNLYYDGVGENKISYVKKIQKILKLRKENTLYFGDDMLDIETKSASEIFCAPANALFYIQSQADLVVPKMGGKGAFRLLLDLILYTQKKHFAQKMISEILKANNLQ